MGYRFGSRLLMGAIMIAALAIGGYYTYNLGVARGLAESAAAATPAAGVPVVMLWPRPWGFGFGWFPVFPLFFILFWIFVARGLFWRRRRWGRGCGYDGVGPAFDEWPDRPVRRGPRGGRPPEGTFFA
jgi:hypothetical protein